MLARLRIAPIALLALIVAGTAWAVTEQQLLVEAADLHAAYEALLEDVQAAEPSQHAALEAAYAALETRRTQLHADRATLGGCTCTQLDALIGAIDDLSDDVGVIIDEWTP